MKILIRRLDGSRDFAPAPFAIPKPQRRSAKYDAEQRELVWLAVAQPDGSIKHMPPSGPAALVNEWRKVNPQSAALFDLADRVETGKEVLWRMPDGSVIERPAEDGETLVDTGALVLKP